MPVDLSAREGVPHTAEHRPGKPYSVTEYNRGCRCEGCTATKANYRLAKLGQPLRPMPGEVRVEARPKRPPGVVWLDWSEITAVVRCERCDKNYGVWLDKSEAVRFQQAHNDLHAGEVAFDWSAWDTARLMKNPGGRPPRDEVPECSREECLEDARTLGMCATHYKAHQRAVARAQTEAVERQQAYEERLRNPPKRKRSTAASLCSAPMCGSRPLKGKYCEAHS